MNASTPRRHEVTVADVARKANVSKAQAARALGGYGAVSEEVHSRVVAAAEALGYRPNMLARSMNTGRSNTIGVVFGDIENPYFALAMRAISDAAKRANYDVILINTGEQYKSEVDAVRVLQDKRVDGFIVAPALAPDSRHLQSVVESGRPLVLFDRRVPDVDVPVIAAEVEQAACDATMELINCGHTRIAFISTLKTSEVAYSSNLYVGLNPVAERLAGMKRAFQQAGINLPESLIRLNAGSRDNVRHIVASLVRGPDRATAIVASDSVIALSVLEASRGLGLNIPSDISFIMYDDFPWTRIVTPPLTVVAQPVYEMGAAAAESLICQIQGRDSPPQQRFVANLILRGSVGPLAAPTEARGRQEQGPQSKSCPRQ